MFGQVPESALLGIVGAEHLQAHQTVSRTFIYITRKGLKKPFSDRYEGTNGLGTVNFDCEL